jgi:hypothetical protein
MRSIWTRLSTALMRCSRSRSAPAILVCFQARLGRNPPEHFLQFHQRFLVVRELAQFRINFACTLSADILPFLPAQWQFRSPPSRRGSHRCDELAEGVKENCGVPGVARPSEFCVADDSRIPVQHLTFRTSFHFGPHLFVLAIADKKQHPQPPQPKFGGRGKYLRFGRIETARA